LCYNNKGKKIHTKVEQIVECVWWRDAMKLLAAKTK
jgi:hypothetical protein